MANYKLGKEVEAEEGTLGTVPAQPEDRKDHGPNNNNGYVADEGYDANGKKIGKKVVKEGEDNRVVSNVKENAQ